MTKNTTIEMIKAGPVIRSDFLQIIGALLILVSVLLLGESLFGNEVDQPASSIAVWTSAVIQTLGLVSMSWYHSLMCRNWCSITNQS